MLEKEMEKYMYIIIDTIFMAVFRETAEYKIDRIEIGNEADN